MITGTNILQAVAATASSFPKSDNVQECLSVECYWEVGENIGHDWQGDDPLRFIATMPVDGERPFSSNEWSFKVVNLVTFSEMTSCMVNILQRGYALGSEMPMVEHWARLAAENLKECGEMALKGDNALRHVDRKTAETLASINTDFSAENTLPIVSFLFYQWQQLEERGIDIRDLVACEEKDCDFFYHGVEFTGDKDEIIFRFTNYVNGGDYYYSEDHVISESRFKDGTALRSILEKCFQEKAELDEQTESKPSM